MLIGFSDGFLVFTMVVRASKKCSCILNIQLDHSFVVLVGVEYYYLGVYKFTLYYFCYILYYPLNCLLYLCPIIGSHLPCATYHFLPSGSTGYTPPGVFLQVDFMLVWCDFLYVFFHDPSRISLICCPSYSCQLQVPWCSYGHIVSAVSWTEPILIPMTGLGSMSVSS